MRISLYKKTIFILMSLALFSCDKKGKPLLSDIKFVCEIDGVIYKDQMSVIIPPGAQRSPEIKYVTFHEDKYIQFTSILTPVSEQTGQDEYSIAFRIPMNENISLGQKYQFEPIKGKEILEGLDNLIYLEGSKQFIRISSLNYNMDTRFYGKGTVVFTEFSLTSRKAKGQVEFTFPFLSLEGEPDELYLKGEFYCKIYETN